jgi:4-hydroxy-3-polyprenylbenzoate decarboxylase
MGNSVERRLIVGITGATGIAYGIELLRALRAIGVQTHLIVSSAGEITRSYESTLSSKELRDLADVTYSAKDVGAAIASGSFKTMGMVIAPCSIRTLSEIASGVSSSLMTRAADVVLKERRRLVLLVRETPLHLGHLRSMVAVTEAGAIVMPPVPAFYMRPESIDDIVQHTVHRVLDLFDLEAVNAKRWGETPELQTVRAKESLS